MNFASIICDIVAEWLWHWTCTPVVLSSSPCCSLDLFSFAPSLTPRLRSVKSQVACSCPQHHKLSIRILTSDNQGHR